MPSIRDEALATLGLAAQPDADAPAVQRAFERLARRYPERHFPERFRALLEARDRLLNPGRLWRDELERPTLDLRWALPYLSQREKEKSTLRAADDVVQDMLRAGYRAEGLELPGMDEDIPF
jgi:curved DNA-binding protein CbpA